LHWGIKIQTLLFEGKWTIEIQRRGGGVCNF